MTTPSPAAGKIGISPMRPVSEEQEEVQKTLSTLNQATKDDFLQHHRSRSRSISRSRSPNPKIPQSSEVNRGDEISVLGTASHKIITENYAYCYNPLTSTTSISFSRPSSSCASIGTITIIYSSFVITPRTDTYISTADVVSSTHGNANSSSSRRRHFSFCGPRFPLPSAPDPNKYASSNPPSTLTRSTHIHPKYSPHHRFPWRASIPDATSWTSGRNSYTVIISCDGKLDDGVNSLPSSKSQHKQPGIPATVQQGPNIPMLPILDSFQARYRKQP